MPFQDNVKVKGKADIVWVLDVSGSMSPIIQAVKDNVAQFVRDLSSSGQSPVESLRLGLVTHDVESKARVHSAPFAETTEDFINNLMAAPDGGSEYGLPAVDCALDFPWRSEARRYIIFITDEPVSGGHDSSGQKAKLEQLCQKMAELHIHFLGYGPDCPAHEQLGQTPGSDYTASIPGTSDHGALSALGFKKALQGLAMTITADVDIQALSTSVPKNIYGL